jgi:hypothetical protein
VDLLSRLNGTGAGGDHQLRATEGDTPAKVNDSALRLKLAAGQLEWLGDANDFANTFEQLKITMIEIAMDADGTENRVRSARGAMHIKTAGDNAVNDALNLLVGGTFLHNNDHG